MPKYRYLLIALAVCSAAWAGYQFWPDSNVEIRPNEAPQMTKAKLTELQNLATESCECRLRGGDPAKCSQAYKNAASEFSSDAYDTACEPLTTDLACFGDEPGQCIVHGYSLIGSDSFVCTESQAKTIEAVWGDAYSRSGESVSKANRAAEAAIKLMVEGNTLSGLRPNKGCV